ncbi:hypothetical protein BC828DRAFT_374512 [Blastocladiella britannica]|nr:hypothetical protein BC828DRAFT_374512 [Blastocladiella britannica]
MAGRSNKKSTVATTAPPPSRKRPGLSATIAFPSTSDESDNARPTPKRVRRTLATLVLSSDVDDDDVILDVDGDDASLDIGNDVIRDIKGDDVSLDNGEPTFMLQPQQQDSPDIILQHFTPTLLRGGQFVLGEADGTTSCAFASLKMLKPFSTDLLFLGEFTVTSSERFQVPPALIAANGTYTGSADAAIGEVLLMAIEQVLVCTRAMIEQRDGNYYYQYRPRPKPTDMPLSETVVYRLATPCRTLADALKVNESHFSAAMKKDAYWKQMRRLRKTDDKVCEREKWSNETLRPYPVDKRLEVRTQWIRKGTPIPVLLKLAEVPDIIRTLDPALVPLVRVIVCALPGQCVTGDIMSYKWCLCLRDRAINDAARSGDEVILRLLDPLLLKLF